MQREAEVVNLYLTEGRLVEEEEKKKEEILMDGVRRVLPKTKQMGRCVVSFTLGKRRLHDRDDNGQCCSSSVYAEMLLKTTPDSPALAPLSFKLSLFFNVDGPSWAEEEISDAFSRPSFSFCYSHNERYCFRLSNSFITN